MRVNVDKVLERDQKLSELDDRADALQAGASQFETSAAKLKRKYWWKNLKMMIILGVICAIVLIIIIGESHANEGEGHANEMCMQGRSGLDVGLLYANEVAGYVNEALLAEQVLWVKGS
uniref:V-SNARE coiled-coil homology domain-containing protein n=1 Tax=Anser cygnoides TaxID=8845 RepID=A0A8B9DRV1_ANSCY